MCVCVCVCVCGSTLPIQKVVLDCELKSKQSPAEHWWSSWLSVSKNTDTIDAEFVDFHTRWIVQAVWTWANHSCGVKVHQMGWFVWKATSVTSGKQSNFNRHQIICSSTNTVSHDSVLCCVILSNIMPTPCRFKTRQIFCPPSKNAWDQSVWRPFHTTCCIPVQVNEQCIITVLFHTASQWSLFALQALCNSPHTNSLITHSTHTQHVKPRSVPNTLVKLVEGSNWKSLVHIQYALSGFSHTWKWAASAKVTKAGMGCNQSSDWGTNHPLTNSGEF